MKMKLFKSWHLTVLLILLILLAACSQSGELAITPSTAVDTMVEETAMEKPTLPATDTIVPAPEVEEKAVENEPETVTESTEEAPPEETAVPVIEAIEVTYFTPAQQEGPYYTVTKPEDRDNDLVDFAGGTGVPSGQVLEFGGRVYDANGLPVEGLVVEIWQTDESGVYLHPGDPDTASRDPNFQFYGEAETDADGSYSFRTILPGQYEPRPPHIHFKVKLEGQELLTSQFYFSDVADLQGEDVALLITALPGQDANGSSILIGERDIILNRAIFKQ